MHLPTSPYIPSCPCNHNKFSYFSLHDNEWKTLMLWSLNFIIILIINLYLQLEKIFTLFTLEKRKYQIKNKTVLKRESANPFSGFTKHWASSSCLVSSIHSYCTSSREPHDRLEPVSRLHDSLSNMLYCLTIRTKIILKQCEKLLTFH